MRSAGVLQPEEQAPHPLSQPGDFDGLHFRHRVTTALTSSAAVMTY
jgi:hypothetical protein